jgi:RHS repeat-associated protein
MYLRFCMSLFDKSGYCVKDLIVKFLFIILLFKIDLIVNAQTTAVGYTKVETNVAENGNAIISVPLYLPKGTFVAPSLSIVYNSQGGDGLLGLGFSLSGTLQAITRVGPTLAQDGFTTNVSFDKITDRYALNGERLIATFAYKGISSGYLTNAASGEFRTEQESYSKVIPYTTNKSGMGYIADSFKVYTKDGLILDFGNTKDSKIEAPNSKDTVIAWLLSRISDRNGNYLTITYAEDNIRGEYRPIQIRYTGNSRIGLKPYNRIDLRYESKPDSATKYFSGFSSKTTKRLREIRVLDHDSVFRIYRLTYLSGSDKSKLTKITEFGFDTVTTLKPVNFTWQQSPTFDFNKFYDSCICCNVLSSTPFNSINGDFDGNGVIDIGAHLGSGKWEVAFFNGIRFDTKFWYTNSNTVSGKHVVGDFDGNGKTDIAILDNNYWNVGLSNGKSFSNSNWHPSNQGNNYTSWYAIEANGDGLTDIACYKGSGLWDVYISNGSSFTFTTWDDGYNIGNGAVQLGDFNGDGRTDLITYSSTQKKWLVSLSTGTSFDSSWWESLANSMSSTFVADVNADGLSDLLTQTGNNDLWIASMSIGNKFKSVYHNITSRPFSEVQIGDFNGDGYTDVFAHNGLSGGPGHSKYVHFGTGSGFKTGVATSKGHYGWYNSASTQDFDGDGITDAMAKWYTKGTCIPNWQLTRSNALKDFVVSVKNGNGHTTSFFYKPLTDKSIYQKDTIAKYPVMDVIAPFYVVATVSQNNPFSGFIRQHYKYAYAKSDMKGRGFRGFQQITTTDSINNKVAIAKYNTAYHCIAVRPIETIVKTIDGKDISNTKNTIGFKRNKFKEDSNCVSYYSKVVEKLFELDGSVTKTTTSDFVYDRFLNVTKLTKTEGNGYTVITESSFTNDSTTWVLGRLMDATVTKTKIGKQPIVKKSSFKYNAKGFLNREIFLSNDNQFKIQTDYALDTFGNRVITTNSTAGETPKVNKTKYDSDGRLVIESQNAAGHKNKFTYSKGIEKTITDVNNLTIRFVRDPFGRELKSYHPDGKITMTSYKEFDQAYDSLWGIDPQDISFFVQTQTSGSGWLRKYYDYLDRLVAIEQQSFVKENILTKISYWGDGTVNFESQPYFYRQSRGGSTTVYDDFKRPKRISHPGGYNTTYVYEGLKSTVVNGEGIETISIVDEQGKAVKSINHNGDALTYDYDSDLNNTTLTDPNGNKISMTYNVIGKQTTMTDPDIGRYRFFYNAWGELTKEVNNKGDSAQYKFDILGRMIKRIEKEHMTEWCYDTTFAIGKVSIIKVDGKIVRNHLYDSLGRLTRVDYINGSIIKSYKYAYNTLGQIVTETYPNGIIIRYIYDKKGYLIEVKGDKIKSSAMSLWKATKYNHSNVCDAFTLGNGLKTFYTYNATFNNLDDIVTTTASSQPIQNLNYKYSKLGKMLSREDKNQNLKETFDYDSLYRLIKSKIGNDSIIVKYDKLGNITYKSDVGVYKYGENNKGPHMLTSIDYSTAKDSSFRFIQNSVTLTSFDYTSYIRNDSFETSFFYGPGRERELLITKKGGIQVLKKFYYGGAYEETIDKTGDTSFTIYIKGATGIVAVVSASFKTKTDLPVVYPLFDHVGSVYAYMDEQSKIAEMVSYDAWGKQRNPYTWKSYKKPNILPGFQRGFTFHEMLELDFLVCMNARVYSPVLGRFLSPDIYIQFPDNLQGLNRFSYVLNNPLSYIDPSGHFSLGKLFKTVIPIIVGAAIFTFTGGFSAGFSLHLILSSAASGFGQSFTSGIVNGQSFSSSLKMGIQGAIESAASAALTVGFSKLPKLESLSSLGKGLNDYHISKSLVNGLVQGGISDLRGGDFRKGFLAGFTKEFGNYHFEGDFTSQMLIAGSVSEISGGSFANGAWSYSIYAIAENYATGKPLQVNSKLIVWKTEFMQNKGALTIPVIGIFIPSLANNEQNKVEYDWGVNESRTHEPGHSLQFAALTLLSGNPFTGLALWGAGVALPSLTSAGIDRVFGSNFHDKMPWETSATALTKFTK